MSRLVQLLLLTAMLLSTARLSQASCLPEDSPPQPNRDALARLLQNLTDPKRDATFHRQQVRAYLSACQKRAAKPEAAVEWFGVLAQRRAEIDQLELSQHQQGSILESPGRVVFPVASAPSGRRDVTPACEIRPR